MSSGPSFHLGKTLEQLANRIMLLQREKEYNFEESARAIAALDRMTDVLSDIQSQKEREKILAEKFSAITDKLESVNLMGRDLKDGKRPGIVLKKFISGTKVTGQVIEIVAVGFQGMLESITKIIRSEQVLSKSMPSATPAKTMDLSSILQPMSSIVQALVNSKPGGGDSKSDAKSDQLSSVSDTADAAPGPAEEQVNNDEYKKIFTAPVVKAIPLVDENSRVQ